MIEFLRGKIANTKEDSVCLDVNGVGYLVMISPATGALLPPEGEEACLYTHMSVREDGVSLYGFSSYDDLSLFKLLITVSGIGPKSALSILSSLSGDGLRLAVVSGDSKSISLAPGVGKKTAERIIIDLKDKLDNPSFSSVAGEDSFKGAGRVIDSAREEAVEALTALGYSASEALNAVKGASAALGDGADSEAVLKAALRIIK